MLAMDWRGEISSMREFAILNDIDWDYVAMQKDPNSDSIKAYAEPLIRESLSNEESFLACLDHMGLKESSLSIKQVNKDLAEKGCKITFNDDGEWELLEKSDEDDNTEDESIVEIKKVENIPEEKIVITKTAVIHKPDPALEKKYLNILTIINESGKSMESQRSSYSDNENKLRDQLVTVLTTHPMGSVTAESSNARGKTDIMVRDNNVKLFIAECKIWKGKKELFDAIDQLLSYTTWRDPFTAIVIFSKVKSISNVLEVVQTQIQNHENYENIIDNPDRSWFNYEFHLPGDKKIKVRLAVLIFKLS